MPPDWFAEVRPLVEDGVRTVIERNRAVIEDPPTKTFYRLLSDGVFDNTTEFTVPVPGRAFADTAAFDTLYTHEFEDVARRIYTRLPDPLADTDSADAARIESIERGLFEFVGVVLNYAGTTRFDGAAFDAAFADQFDPRFTDREYARYLLCLKNTTLEPDVTIDLETAIHGEPDYLGPYDLDTLRLRPLDELEEVGITTHEAPSTGVLEPVEPVTASGPTAAVEIVLRRRRPYSEIAREIDDNIVTPWNQPEFDVTPNDVHPWQQLIDVIRYIATTVRRCLRLCRPAGTVGFDTGYHVVPGWETYRGIATPVTFPLEFDCPAATVGTHIAANRAADIRRFWSAHRDRLSTDDATFQNPLARFERMFSRDALEDQLVDCAVGCETTLLKGGSPGGNKYRLGVRAAVLLGEQNSQEWPPEQVGEFFRAIYDARNTVVHEDNSLPDAPSDADRMTVGDDEFLAPSFLVRARELYADVIRGYLDLVATHDDSIDDINQRIDETVLASGNDLRDRLS
ncbi:hypothetical protein [Natrinema altunense]|uniref:Apea-like HEPN domain-containing protein n=1 Tax=Natrinema altunense TaxID=222984 RepID=A0A482XWY7_9EURY|nr:hypothetical protein [Natrinema altunense]RZH66464.1 hypothetical protein ELS17_17460 [Natrinema altunense]